MSPAHAEPTRAGGVDYAELALMFHAAREGSRSAFDELIGILTPVLWQVARAQGLDREHSADVVQTAWLKLLGSLEQIHSPGALTGWLITVTRREAWRVRAAHRAEQPFDDLSPEPDPGPGPESRLMAEDRRIRLWAALRELPEQCRTLLRIVAFVHRPDYGEVSAALGMKKGSIGPTRGRCLAKLRRLLIDSDDGEWR